MIWLLCYGIGVVVVTYVAARWFIDPSSPEAAFLPLGLLWPLFLPLLVLVAVPIKLAKNARDREEETTDEGSASL